MEPKRSMTAYAFVVTATACIAAVMNMAAVALVMGVVVLIVGFGFDYNYGRWRRALNRASSRQDLDPLVRKQWTASAALTLAAAALTTHYKWFQLGTAPLVLKVLVACIAAAAATVFTSSLVDWYWILPRVSGVVCPAPCEIAGQEQWTYVTGHWIFHRLMTELLVSAAIVAVPASMAAATSGDAVAFWGVVAVLITTGIAYREKFIVAAIFNAGDPRTKVGDVVRIRHEVDETFVWAWAYVMDVSVRGVKVVLLDGLRYMGKPFARKGDYLMAADEALASAPRTRDATLCRFAADQTSLCTGVNWYCRNNPLAHRQSAPEPFGEALGPDPPQPAKPVGPGIVDDES